MLRTFFKKILPWLVAAGVFVYLFRQYPPANIYKSLIFINIPLFGAVAIAYFVIMFFIDTFSISKVLGIFGHRESMRELMPARGLTYLLMVINYAASQAAFAFYQNRKHGLPISKMLGIFGIIVVIDLLILAVLAFVTTFFTTWPFHVGGMNIAHFVRLAAAIACAGFALIIFLVKMHARSPILKRLGRNALLKLIASTRSADYLKVTLARLPVHTFIMCGMYVAIKTFNAHVPFVKVLSNIPIVFFIGSLPVTPGGLGTSNVALVELFKPFVTSPSIASGAISAGDLLFSFSLVWMFANYLMKALTGVVCLKFVSRDLFKPTPDVTEEEAEHEASHMGGNI